jgi:hypothetical protein
MTWRTQTLLLHVLLAALALLWSAAREAVEESSWQILSAEMSAVPASDIEAAQELPDTAWSTLDQAQLARWQEPYWLRFRVQAPAVDWHQAWLLTLSLRGASEVYWNGESIGRNGQPAARAADEKPGRIDAQFLIDRASVSAGQHSVLVHASSHRVAALASANAGVRILSYTQARRYLWRWLPVALALGAIGCALAYWSLAWRAPDTMRDSGRIWLLALGAVGLMLPIVEAWRSVFGYDYDWHLFRLVLVLCLHGAAALLLPGYLIARYGGGVRWFAALAGAWLLLMGVAWTLDGFDVRSWVVQVVGLGLALVVAGSRWRQPESRPLSVLLASTLLLALIWPGAFLDGLYFLALAVLMVWLMLSHVAFLRRLGERSVRLGAERDRLRAQLLRRAIQPHWLMNSLTSLQELIEAEPPRANRLVELLAAHFSLLRAHSERDQVRLDEELALCRVQLDIASLAQQAELPWRVDGDVDGIVVPPGVLHCLIENALTHAGFRASAEQGFVLRIERQRGRIRLELLAPLAASRSTSTADAGTGTRFVRASLERVWGREASFADGPRDGRWCSEMQWPCAS